MIKITPNLQYPQLKFRVTNHPVNKSKTLQGKEYFGKNWKTRWNLIILKYVISIDL